jgi:serine/threonine-protein kinase
MPTIQREPYLMMELLRGRTLADVLERQEELHFLDALELTEQVLAALSIIHDAGLVHRDIKPSNLFLIPDPQIGLLLKVMDLGLAAARPKGSGSTGLGVERDQHPGMTPKYASPEQFGEFAVGPASDVYSLGTVLYEMITGRMLFPVSPSDPPIKHGLRRLKEAPKSPAVHVPELPDEVSEFVLSLLEKDLCVDPQWRPR